MSKQKKIQTETREKKRKEKKLLNQGEALTIKVDYSKNDPFDERNKSSKYLDIKEEIEIKDEFFGIKDNDINIKKNYLIGIRTYLSYFVVMFKYLIVLDLFIKVLPSNKLYLLENNLSKIILKINGIGIKKVFSNNNQFKSNYYPNEVYINGKKQDSINYSYNLTQANNIIELIWNNEINNCQYMFEGCSDINEIDLSNFDSSKVISMYQMFSGCSLLTSLNLNNFDTF